LRPADAADFCELGQVGGRREEAALRLVDSRRVDGVFSLLAVLLLVAFQLIEEGTVDALDILHSNRPLPYAVQRFQDIRLPR
jgi:hypothetical protein